jgi:hypothetical protein
MTHLDEEAFQKAVEARHADVLDNEKSSQERYIYGAFPE